MATDPATTPSMESTLEQDEMPSTRDIDPAESRMEGGDLHSSKKGSSVVAGPSPASPTTTTTKEPTVSSPVARTATFSSNFSQQSQQRRTLTPTPMIPKSPRSPISASVGVIQDLSAQDTPGSSRAQSVHSSYSHQSTFSAGDAARHLGQEHVARTSQDMFRKVTDYVKSEMLMTGEEYKLLENMNNLTRERYADLAGMAQELMHEVGKLRTTYSDFEPYLARIDEICQQADFISNVASELDEYTKSLEVRLKRVTK
ncbi:biogenesis of lysosome- organelles complex 1 subunit 2 [Lunasporangiospora selenospora]|uniref:Biogenesis of lysosome- organelles complex 1 subunit 2 n=1 Tax=Lunasporangiospora selenospora TaxID=979761 RepID=A0A9P6KHJ3_9FUNG|nr:biogenesis of lysosome- organelles complex 1 subunit 2 [Lunasporangiospora selenospora]